MPEKRPLENGSSSADASKRPRLVEAKKSGALVQKLLALQTKLESNPKLKALRSANQARSKQALEASRADGQRPPLPSQISIYSAARSTASALEAAARATNPSIASRFSSGQIVPGTPSSDSLHGTGPSGKQESQKFFDPYIGKKGGRRDRYRKSFWFVDEGRYEKEAELERIRAKYGDEVAIRIQLGRLTGLRGVKREDIQRYLDAGKKVETLTDNIEDVDDDKGQEDEMQLDEESDVSEPPEEIPDVEWWDQALLVNGSYDDVTEEGANIKPNKITIYIQHPVPIEPPAESLPPPPQPLKLTKKEMKKLRSQRRQQREKEKQELIRQGLLEPPKPKVKISNMMRVLAEEAAADPTAIEKEVRKAMEERQQAHEDRNLARKLTPAEKKDKKLKKLFDDGDVDEQACLFKVSDLSNPKNKYKVTINAEENRLTGRCVIADGYAIVVVEGCQKSVRRYKRLMLHRIKWNDAVDAEDEDVDANGGMMKPRVVNSCHLVWEGSVKKPFFTDFQSQEILGEHSVRRYFERFKVGHYLELVKGFDQEAATGENYGGAV